MDAASAKTDRRGPCCIGTGVAGVGVGNLFGQSLQGALRNPSDAPNNSETYFRLCGD